MENRIKVLPLEIINQIAAGEVVERPASIAKELLENALDSGASGIILNLEKSGLEAITVIDNGSGMNSLEANTALLQHATSKILAAADLENISSLGFRGEALASISSISDIRIHSYDSKDKPVTVNSVAGQISITTGPGRDRGTTVRVNHIFKNIPVRRKFLRSETTEYKYILETFVNIVLAHPRVTFSLIRNGKTVYQLSACQDLSARFLQIYKHLKAADLIRVHYDDPRIKVSGWVCAPNLIKQGEHWQYLFINGRSIRNALLNKAVREGYGTVLMKEMTPAYLIDLKLPASLVDVNVHPRKLEVRFTDPGSIYQAVKKAVSHALETTLQHNLQEQFHNTAVPLPQQRSAVKQAPESYPGVNFKPKPMPGPVKKSLEFTQQLLKDNSDISRLDLGNALQVFDTYIVINRGDKLLMIDQHAADERINYERLTDQFNRNENQTTQKLLLPETIALSARDIETLRENLKLLNMIGFGFAEISPAKVVLNEIPLLLVESDLKSTFLEIIHDFDNSAGTESARWKTVSNKVIATLACHGSIRAGKRMTAIEIDKLITDLFQCTLPYSCPHGRPIIWELSRTEIEKQFKRKL